MPVSHRLASYGTSIFTEMTRLANEKGAINLSQGFPDFDGPEFVRNAAIDAIRAGHNQYARMSGVPPLNNALASRWQRLTGQAIDPDTQVSVTNGCTEAIAATCLGLLNPGDEVITFEPYYDSYRPCIEISGGVPVVLTLAAPMFSLNRDAFEAAITPRTRAVIINTPHNPTGKVFSRDELTFVAEMCIRHNLIAITDEVYEHLVFEGQHVRLATLPGMAERTITLSSVGKTFSLTGWKIGWAIASPDLSRCVRSGRQFLSYSVATPLQHAAAAAVSAGSEYLDAFLREYRQRRDLLCEALEEIGFVVYRPAGTYFVLADHTPFGFADDRAFCAHLIDEIGVAAIPPTPFYDHVEFGKPLVRFAFCKRLETLNAAIDRLRKLRPR
ncbi:MAG: aminotransferase class I/II-fold pyridoxal phosphate-dependent enzyme [Phycisphaerales bacterium]|nr:aminotransferase class I/II-fold pyridoxal phosphate-dependent enzyme [Phycisphaerales bacterium]